MAKLDNSKFYKQAINKYGVSAKGVHWASSYTQYKRFEILSSFINEELKNSSIIDAGCGFGEYFSYLLKNSKEPKTYLGVDCEEVMINLASKRFPTQNFKVQNILLDNLSKADYYICSGAMNILLEEEVYIFIKRCFEASQKAFIFNFLKNDPLTNIKSKNIIAFCKTLSKKIEIKEHYLENDFSIYMEK